MSTPRRLLAFSSLLLLGTVVFFTVQAAAQDSETESSADALSLGEDTAETLNDRAFDVVSETEQEVSPKEFEAGQEAFLDVAEVLQSPRCMNCHPAGNRPLQTDESRPHSFNISRESTDSGLDCATCHREQNSEAWGVAGGPPGAPHWGLPPRDMPMVFEGRSPKELCEQLKDPEMSGHDDLDGFIEHLTHDKLVHWGWEPGGDRSTPPLAYEVFLSQAKTWVAMGAPCPE